ncbi:hypothetical protein GWR56_10790 [Mucilaginibacter sp. 14171R-50]|uniref:hypothetical protein n=1 Tax=Mucilaginibacter sp. 14171R-50 TaxID=2703789 RepID=UPI00138DC4EE|nr:hypothetical protein [Mucilaginibacter sp. 14171R-50]QHS55996.1 hypothetical protein GWR56_10790 [Mucilaginibacter sp. 14171R-50]
MKKFFAILLLLIHFFNWGGYMLLQNYMLELSDRRMNDLISHNLYNPNALVELKIKQNLPGINEWPDYKNVSGSIQLKNACYNYVKLKFTKDTLYVMCVPNYEKTKLIDNNVIYAKQINDIPTDKGNDTSAKKGGPDVKYDHPQLVIRFLNFENIQPRGINKIYNLSADPFIGTPGQPPETLG